MAPPNPLGTALAAALQQTLEEKLYRNWMAKEKMASMSDETFDKIIATLNEVGGDKMSTFAILKAIEAKYPELVKEFQDLL